MKYLFMFPYIHNRFLSALPAWKDDIVWAARIFQWIQKPSVSFFFMVTTLFLLWLWGFCYLYLSSWFSTMHCTEMCHGPWIIGSFWSNQDHQMFISDKTKIRFILNSNGRDSFFEIQIELSKRKKHTKTQ